MDAQLKYENDKLKLALAQSSANAKKWESELQNLRNNNARLTTLQESTANVEEWKKQLLLYQEQNNQLRTSRVQELEFFQKEMDESMFNENDLRSSPSPELHSDRSSLGNNSSLDKSEYEAASSDTLSLDCDNSGFSHKSYDSVMFQTAYGSPDMMSETPPEHINAEKLEGSPFITPRSKKRQQKRSLTDVCLFNGSFEENELDDIAEKQIIPSSSSIRKEPNEICPKLSTIFGVDEKSKMQTLNHYMTELSLDMTTPSDLVANHDQDEIGNETNIIPCDLDVRTPKQTLIYQWKDCSMTSNCGDEPRICIPASYHKLTTDEIRKRIIDFGEESGPITVYTKEVYLRKLIKLEQGQTGKAEKKNSPFVQYPAEVRMVLLGRTPVPELSQLEEQIIKEFGDKKKQWREGNEKSSFNYLLLDPRVSCNLPARSKDLSNTEAFRLFILSVFYVGKGKRARPHAHLREAVKSQITGKVNKKISQIWDIWNAGLGVISLHVFQSAIPAEAFTREACMIDALGLQQLTNRKSGSYHGFCFNLHRREQKNLGIFFLHKAYQIFLQEGERQIKRDDI